MEEKKTPENVPYIVHEGDMARLERSNKRLLIALAIALIVMLLNNVAWLVHEHIDHQGNAWEITSETQP